MSNPTSAENSSRRPDSDASASTRSVDFTSAISRFWANWSSFSGRASRSEFWWAVLFLVLVESAISMIGVALQFNRFDPFQPQNAENLFMGLVRLAAVISIYVWYVATIIPALAVASRRLHDTDRSAAFILLGLIPVVGWIILAVLLAGRGRASGARFDQR